MKTLTKNKQAKRDYEISDIYEAGIVLTGWEVKAVKAGKISIDGTYITEKNEELYLRGAKIYPLDYAPSRGSESEIRNRKLLLHKKEINKIGITLKNVGFSLIPLEIFLNDRNLIKIKIGVGKGKKKFDKRNKLKEKSQKKAIEQDRKRYNF